MSLWEAVVLGVIQGLTEFLPISSTAHLLVARQLMHHDNPRDAFTTAIQLGTLVAVFVYFPADVCGALLKDFIKGTLYGTWVIAWAAIVFAILLLAAEMWSKRRANRGLPGRTEEEVSWLDAVF